MITLILGNCVDKLKEIQNESIDLIVTSPPYDNLREYKGYSFEFEKIAAELYRVIKDGGVIVWVVGDATIGGSETGTSFKQALYFKELGLNLHDTMVYKKENPTWNATCKRYRQSIEYMFILSKNRVNTFNPIEDVRVKNLTPRKVKSNRNSVPKYEWHIPSKEYTARNNVWEYAVGGESIDHPAPFPLKLAKDHIMTWSNEGDTVLDPFLGSGTTGVAASLLGRKFIGIEIAPEYLEVARKRIAKLDGEEDEILDNLDYDEVEWS